MIHIGIFRMSRECYLSYYNYELDSYKKRFVGKFELNAHRECFDKNSRFNNNTVPFTCEIQNTCLIPNNSNVD